MILINFFYNYKNNNINIEKLGLILRFYHWIETLSNFSKLKYKVVVGEKSLDT